jgi:hypothetical protein
MLTSQINQTDFARGQKHHIDLDVGHSDIHIPVILIRGTGEGPTLVVTAGVHGDEYEGVRTIFEITESLHPADMSGDLIAVPTANPPAFWAGTRCSPLDDANLARVFPGVPDQGPSEAIAHALAQQVIAQADFYIDLHSAGVACLMPTMVGYYANDPRGRAAAECFGAPVTWSHPTIAPGRTISFAHERGIPWLYTEARGAGRIHPDDLRVFTNGVTNLMKHLGMIAGKPADPSTIKTRLHGDGNIDAGLLCEQEGFFIPDVDLLDTVTVGQQLGRTLDLHGQVIETYEAPSDGIVALVHQFPVVKPGDPMLVVTQTES